MNRKKEMRKKISDPAIQLATLHSAAASIVHEYLRHIDIEDEDDE